jgi:hypothetical protein
MHPAQTTTEWTISAARTAVPGLAAAATWPADQGHEMAATVDTNWKRRERGLVLHVSCNSYQIKQTLSCNGNIIITIVIEQSNRAIKTPSTRWAILRLLSIVFCNLSTIYLLQHAAQQPKVKGWAREAHWPLGKGILTFWLFTEKKMLYILSQEI